MKKIKKCENFERVDEEDKSLIANKRIRTNHILIKALIFIIFIDILAAMFLLFINSKLNSKDKELKELDDKNPSTDSIQKNYKKKDEVNDTLNGLEKDLLIVENNISKYTCLINEYDNKIKDLGMGNESVKYRNQLTSLKKMNEDKMTQFEGLIGKLRKVKFEKSAYSEKKYSLIFDNKYEIEFIRKHCQNDSGYLTYVCGLDHESVENLYERCKYEFDNPNKDYILIMQTDLFDRFGFFISNHQEKNSIIFNINDMDRNITIDTNGNEFFFDWKSINGLKIPSSKKNDLKEVVSFISKINKRNYYKPLMAIQQDSSLQGVMDDIDLIFNIIEIEIYYV